MQHLRSRTRWLYLSRKGRCFLADERGQAASEYVLVIGLISIPIFVAFELVFKKFLHDFIAAVITNFTRG